MDSKIYTPAQIRGVNAWALEFAYETGSVEQSQKGSGDSEVKVVNKGQLPQDLQLRDDLFYILKDEYSIPMTKMPADAKGRIQIHPIHSYRGYKLLTVTLVDKQGETLARIKISNGTRNATFKDDDEFTRYAAKAIAEALQQK